MPAAVAGEREQVNGARQAVPHREIRIEVPESHRAASMRFAEMDATPELMSERNRALVSGTAASACDRTEFFWSTTSIND
jgi:hypothetical protein